MHVIAERDALLASVSFAERRAKDKTIPILGNILLTAKDDCLSVMGHSLDASSSAELPAECSSPGSLTVPAKNLSILLNGAAKGSTVTLKQDGTILQVSFGKSRYRLPTLPASDFPPALGGHWPHSIALDKAALSRIFDTCSGLADVSSSNPAYNGIFLHPVDGHLAAACSDGHQFLRACTEAAYPGELPSIIVPIYAAEEILKMGQDGELQWNDRLLSFKTSNRLFACKLIEGHWVDYNKVAVGSEDQFLEFDRMEMIEACRRLSSLSDDRGISYINWDAEASSLQIAFSANGEGKEEIECSACGLPSGSFGAPPWQIVRLLNAIDADRVRFHVIDSRKPFRITAPGRPDILGLQVPCYVAPVQQHAA